MPISVNMFLFSNDRYSSVLTRAVTLWLPSFLARIALTMFTSCDSDGFTAMNRSASCTPASRSTPISDEFPFTVTMSAIADKLSRRPWSLSMTVISLDSLLSILARCEPTSPAPAITIRITFSKRLNDYLIHLMPNNARGIMQPS